MGSIRSRLLASHLLALLLLSVLLFAVWMTQLRQATIDEHLDELKGDARQMVSHFYIQLELHKQALERMALGRPVQEYHRTYRELALIDFLDDFSSLFDVVVLADAAGVPEVRLNRGEVSETEDRSVPFDRIRAMASKPGRVQTWRFDNGSGPMVWVGVALYDYFAHKLDGYLLAGFPLENLLAAQKGHVQASGRTTALFDPDGALLQVVAPEPVTAGADRVDVSLRPNRTRASRLGLLQLFGEEGLAAAVYLQDLDASLLLFAPMARIEAQLRGLFKSGLLVLAAVLLTMIPVVAWLSGRLAGPLHRLGACARRVASGDFDARVEVSSAGELGQLINSFNAMAARLKQTMVSKGYLRDIVDSMHEALVVLDRDGKIIRTNLAARQLFGERMETEDVLSLLGRCRDELMELISGRERGSWDVFMAKESRDLQVSFAPTDHGGLVMVLQDVSSIRQAERTLRQQAQRLEESNRELEQFAYVASHDLQEPLRKITAFGERLEAKCGDGLGATGQDYLARMRSAAGRMQTLISDLLNFSRVSTRAQPFEPVDLNEVVRGVVEDLEVRIGELGAELNVAELPTVDAEPLQMRQLLQNLVGNALKFHRPDVPPVISIGAEPLSQAEEDWVRLTVTDNGIGFDEKYLDRIFGVFQRLHGRSEYEGSGIGLAICQKIVRRHGGAITARSRVGEGTTFIIDLPAHQRGRQNTEDAA